MQFHGIKIDLSELAQTIFAVAALITAWKSRDLVKNKIAARETAILKKEEEK